MFYIFEEMARETQVDCVPLIWPGMQCCNANTEEKKPLVFANAVCFTIAPHFIVNRFRLDHFSFRSAVESTVLTTVAWRNALGHLGRNESVLWLITCPVDFRGVFRRNRSNWRWLMRCDCTSNFHIGYPHLHRTHRTNVVSEMWSLYLADW